MFAYIFGLFLVAWEMLCCKLLVETFAEKKRYKYELIPAVIFCGLIIADYFLVYFLYGHLFLKIIAVIILLSTIMSLLFYIKLSKIIVLIILYQGLGVACDYSAILLLGKMFPMLQKEQMTEYGISNLITIISRIVLLFIILIIRRKFGKNTEESLAQFEWVQLLIIPTITIVSIIALVLKFNVLVQITQDDVLLYIALGMAAMNVVVFFLMESILKREKIIRENILLDERAKSETKLYYSVSENFNKQSKLIHEFKNHMACMGELIRNASYEELKNYYEEIDKELVCNADIVDTHNVIVNAVLNTKYREAIEKGIVLVLKVNDLSGLKLVDTDIVIILSNLLNNAIEACEKCENKTIKLKFVMDNEQVIISVKNSMRQQPLRNGNTFLTTKEYNKEEHGVGIRNVIEIIEKYEGKYRIDFNDNEFSFSIIL